MSTRYELELQNSEERALIDEEDREVCQGFVWRLMQVGYVGATRANMHIYLHRLIAGAGTKEVIDHMNGDPLDNRKANLRVATRSQNSANRPTQRGASRFKGVSWDKERKLWFASIHKGGKTRALGRFKAEEDAALAYNVAAVEVWGEFAKLNVIGVE